MRRMLVAMALGAVAISLVVVSALSAAGTEPGVVPPSPAVVRSDFAPGQVIVQFKTGTTAAERARLRRAVGAADASGAPVSPSLRNLRLWSVPQGMTVDQAVARLRANAHVRWAGRNRVLTPATVPNDPDFGFQWALDNTGQTIGDQAGIPGADISMPQAWDIESGASSRTTVAVIDSGIDLAHPELATRLWTNTRETAGNGLDDDGNGYVDDVHGYDWRGVTDLNWTAWDVGNTGASFPWAIESIRGTGAQISYVTLALLRADPNQVDAPRLYVYLKSTLSGDPLATAILEPSGLPGDPGWVKLTFDHPVWLEEGVTYYLMLRFAKAGSFTGACYYGVDGVGSYKDGARLWYSDGTGWITDESKDLCFATDANGTPRDEFGHGTATAGVIASVPANGVGLAGMNAGARIMSLKIASSDGRSLVYDEIQALHYAADNGADVAVVGFAHNDYDQLESDAVQYAKQAGVLVVAPAGNDGTTARGYPASCDGVISVGATDNRDAWWPSSQYNDAVDVSAPGRDIVTSWPTYPVARGDGWGEAYSSGTSLAAAHVAGLASLVHSYNPFLTPDQMTSVIKGNTDDLGPAGRDDKFGSGRIDAYATLLDTPAAPLPSGTMAIDFGAPYTASRSVTVVSNVADATLMRTSVNGTTWSVWGPYAANATVSLPDADGTRTVWAQYCRVAYRVLELTDTIVLDRSQPLITGVASTTHPDPGGWYQSGNAAVTWTASDDSGIAGYSYVWDTSAGTTPDTISEGTSARTSKSGLPQGVTYFHVRALDSMGNWGPAAQLRIQVDSTLPAGTMVINDGAAFTTDPRIALVSSVTDNLTPLNQLAMRYSTNGGSTWSSWLQYAARGYITLPAGDGDRRVYTQYMDLAGNTRTLDDNITLDTTGPAISTLTSSSHPDPATWYQNATFVVSWTPGSDLSGVAGYSVVIDHEPTTTPDAFVDGTDNSGAFSRFGTGQLYFHIRAVDGLGNWGPSSHYAFKLDRDPPNGEMLVNGGDLGAGTAAVWLSSYVSDDFTATADMEMRYSVNGGSVWSGWLPYSDGFEITLPEPDGLKTVVAEYRDLAGNVRQYHCDIWLDRVAPEAWNSTSEDWVQNCTLQIYTSDVGSGVTYLFYRVDGGPWHADAAADAYPLQFKAGKRGGASGVHTVDYYCYDWASNQSTVGQATVSIDGRPPVTTDDLPRNPADPGLPVVSSVPVTVNLTANDAHSGVWQTFSSLDGAAFTPQSSVSIPVPRAGSVSHWLGYYSVDYAWNIEQVHWVRIIMSAP